MSTQDGCQTARIIVATDGVWRAGQLAEVIDALDRLCCRIVAASSLADALERYEFVLSNLRIMGLLDKGPVRQWGESTGGTESLARSDYLKLSDLLRRYGVNVRETGTSWSLEFDFEDILDVVPPSRRLEVEAVRMSSPGVLSFLMSISEMGEKVVGSLSHVFNSLFYYAEMKRIMKATARIKEGEAELKWIEVLRGLTTVPTMEQATYLSPASRADHERELDAITGSLRNGGCTVKSIKKSFTEPVEKEVGVLTRHKSRGMIIGIDIEIVEKEESKSQG